MAKREVPIDRMTEAISKILEEYGEDVQYSLDEIVSKLSKQGAKTLRAQSKSTFNRVSAKKPYAQGWTSQVETGRFSAQGTIYNKNAPGLPHLLEYGHALRRGGRDIGQTSGRAHIKPVEEALIKEFEQKVKSKL